MINWIIITGAASGIGKVTSEVLSKKYNILALVRKKEDMIVFNHNKRIKTLQVDITSNEHIDKLIEYIDTNNLMIYALINNAGIFGIGLLSQTTITEFQRVFNVNVFGTHRISSALLPILIKNRGKIIIIGSDAGLINYKFNSLYCMTKFAIEAYADALMEELEPLKVNVILIEPGNFSTPILEKSYNNTTRILNKNNIYFHKIWDNFISNKNQDLLSFKKSRKPIIVAKKIEQILNNDKTNNRLLMTDRDETDHVISTLIDKIVLLNQSSDFKIENEELHNKLEFSLNL